MEDKNWEEAKKHFDDVLNCDAQCAEAYIGILMADFKLPNMDALATSERNYEDDGNFRKAMLFAQPDLKKQLTEKLEAFRVVFAVRKDQLAVLRSRAEKVEKLFAAAEKDKIAFYLKCNGKIYYDKSKCDKFDNYLWKQLDMWEDIGEVAYGRELALGLKADGTVIGTKGYSSDDISDIKKWTSITRVGVCELNNQDEAIGLKADGTVVTTGAWDLSQWTDIASVFCDSHIIGIKSDGTVLSTGPWDLSSWTDIVAAGSGDGFVVGLRSDGTVCLEADWNREYELAVVRKWRDIISIHACGQSVAGLKSDGTIVATTFVDLGYRNSKNIIAFKMVYSHRKYNTSCNVLCLKADGTAEFNGNKLEEWKLFKNIDTLEHERLEARRKLEEQRIARQKREEERVAQQKREEERVAQQKREEERVARQKREEEERIARQKREEERIAQQKKEEERRIAAERRAAGLCQHCGGELKGFFSKKCTSCGQKDIKTNFCPNCGRKKD